ncbi:MAG: P1 family peptidase [Rubrobacter sp.]|nr:P1 family peptidase [Rubrobacter sp.]
MRAREIGIELGDLPCGHFNAITDVPGVAVGHTTLIEGESVRTGVTVVQPHSGNMGAAPLFAGCHRINGNGELTGLEWVRESGMLGSPIAITNTFSVGVVRDALCSTRRTDGLPVVGETWDGDLNDIYGMHVTADHLHSALASAASGPVQEGNVGGGTGMICHEFKGGIGTASRLVPEDQGGWTVGALVQANYGSRSTLRVDGAPVGRVLTTDRVPSPFEDEETEQPPGTGSIIVVLATDAPLLPIQCDRLAIRAGVGLARMGGGLDDGSGDIFLAFATGNRGLPRTVLEGDVPQTVPVRMLPNGRMTPLFHAAAEATEAAILNALLAAGTVTGRDGTTAHGLAPDALLATLEEARLLRGGRS